MNEIEKKHNTIQYGIRTHSVIQHRRCAPIRSAKTESYTHFVAERIGAVESHDQQKTHQKWYPISERHAEKKAQLENVPSVGLGIPRLWSRHQTIYNTVLYYTTSTCQRPDKCRVMDWDMIKKKPHTPIGIDKTTSLGVVFKASEHQSLYSHKRSLSRSFAFW